MTYPSPRLARIFAWLGHSSLHMLVALYLTIVLAVERTWHLPYDELIALWTPGALLLGLGAPLAGWLGDRWSRPGMMVIYFLGAGVSVALAGLATTTWQLMAALTALGLFGSIYHPVGMAWLVGAARRRGLALGIFGVFGSLGVAAAGVVAATLIDFVSWRSAFIVPGAVTVALGLALWVCLAKGLVAEQDEDAATEPEPSRGDMVRAFFVLSLTVLCAGLIYHATQIAMPKYLSDRLAGLLGEGTLGVGALFTAIYLIGGSLQIWGGHLADRYPLRLVYGVFFVVQIPILALAASVTGLSVIGVAMVMVALNSMSQPAENSLLARYTPGKWRGTAFGAKFVLSLGITPFAVQLVAWIYGTTGGFMWMFVTLAGAAGVVALSTLMLPRERVAVLAPAAAE
ncbi:MAG: MFS transporter [Alphaproteobacteria bacterium]